MRSTHVHITGLGLTAKHKRVIVPGQVYDRFFPKTEQTDPILNKDGDVKETVKLCEKIVYKTLGDTKAIAQYLKRPTLEETAQAIFNFFYRHYQYKEDAPGVEQLRRPARAWRDRKEGIDCDCFSISISSILTNLQVPHYFRIVKLYNRSYFQHIYVIVPRSKDADISKRENYIVIDPVLDQFDLEAPGISQKKDYTMGLPIQYLNGLSCGPAMLTGSSDFEGLGSMSLHPRQRLINALTVYRNFLKRKKRHLVQTRNTIRQRPELVSRFYKPQVLVGMLDEAIGAWDNDQAREATLERLSGIEYEALQNPSMNGLGSLGGFFDKLKKVGNKLKEGVKKGAKWVATQAKKVAKVILKYNPLSIAARAGFRLAMKLNFGFLASKAYWGYFTQEEAKAKGVSAAYWKKAHELKNKIEHIFVSLLKGEAANLRNDIIQGGRKRAAKGNLKGTEGLGVVATATITAAMAFLTPLIAFAKNIFGKGGKDDAEEGSAASAEGSATDSAAPEESSSAEPQEAASSEGSSSADSGGNKGDKKSKTLMYVGIAAAAVGVLYLATRNNNPVPVAAPYAPAPVPQPPQIPVPAAVPVAPAIAGVRKRKRKAVKKPVKAIRLT